MHAAGPGRGPPDRWYSAGGAGIEPVASRGPRRLAKPKPVRVSADPAGRPQKVGKREVDAVRESWLVEDRWWTDAPCGGATGRWSPATAATSSCSAT